MGKMSVNFEVNHVNCGLPRYINNFIENQGFRVGDLILYDGNYRKIKDIVISGGEVFAMSNAVIITKETTNYNFIEVSPNNGAVAKIWSVRLAD